MNTNEENLNEEIKETKEEVSEETPVEENKVEEETVVEEAKTESSENFEMPVFGKEKKAKKSRRVLRGDFVALVCLVLLVIISAVKIPSFLVDSKLEKLGYNEKAIEAIKDLKISKTITSNKYYSDYLAAEVTKESFRPDYLELYVYETKLTDNDFLVYDKLIKLGYTKEEVLRLFKDLNPNEISALVVFEKQANLDTYVNDCIKNRAINKNGSLVLNGNYFKPYENITTAPNIGTTSVIANKRFNLGNYVPANLTTLNTRYAVDGVELVDEAAKAFVEMCNEMSSNNLGIYAIDGYRSYEGQKSVYESYSSPAESELKSIRPGHSEQQTGLLVMVVDGTNEDLSLFPTSPEYKWLSDNAAKYGFILRYPENKESVTAHDAESYTFRYVGVDLATKIKKSGLTFEEYYFLYMNQDVPANSKKDK